MRPIHSDQNPGKRADSGDLLVNALCLSRGIVILCADHDSCVRLAPLVKSIVIITGRPALTAVEYGGFGDVPGLTVLGQYGLERWADGVFQGPEPHPGVAEAREKLPLILQRWPDGIFVEDKGHALAIHTRRTAEPDFA